MITDKRSANAIGGKTARACDSCLLKRARWYCTADDAFLCQSCDTFIHSANQLASRHERLRLGTTPTTSSSAPTWHQGFTKKARTPRHNNKSSSSQKQQPLLPLVPEIGNEEDEEVSPFDENNYEDQAALLYQVPVFEPFGGELCDVPKDEEEEVEREQRNNNTTNGGSHDGVMDHDLENFSGFLPSDMELAEFAADVESLLGGGGRVKVEDQEEEEMTEEAVFTFQFNPTMEVTRGAFEWNFDYELSVVGEEDYEEEKVMADVMETKKITSATMMMMKKNSESEEAEMKRRKISLKLNYDGVVTAWANQGCPWTTGIRPDYNPDDCWPNLMVGMCPTNVDQHQLELGDIRQVGMGDGAREAKVLRYKEKRRTRLFSKKIRYEVRKLNAEKRPRMRGRFVKRSSSSFTGPACFS